jgi:hypothetical protein
LLHYKVLEIIFPMSDHLPQSHSEQESYTLLLHQCKLSRADFRMCDAQRFGCNSLYGSPKMLNLDALERRLSGDPEYLNFLLFTSLNKCLMLMSTAVSFRFLEVDDLNFIFYHKLMGLIRHVCKTTLNHQVPPR